MDAQAIKNLGGALQIIGVVIVVWDLLNVHQYLGDLTRLRAWLQTRRVRVEGWLRRLLRRPGRSVVVHAHPASMAMIADLVTARLTPDPFVARPDQSPTEQLAAQAEYLNRLRDWIMREVQRRDEAIEAERAQAQAELRAEGQRLERLLDQLRGEVDRLASGVAEGAVLDGPTASARGALFEREAAGELAKVPNKRAVGTGGALVPDERFLKPPRVSQHAGSLDQREVAVGVAAGVGGVRPPGECLLDPPGVSQQVARLNECFGISVASPTLIPRASAFSRYVWFIGS
jgi:hypothetical protein